MNLIMQRDAVQYAQSWCCQRYFSLVSINAHKQSATIEFVIDINKNMTDEHNYKNPSNINQ